MSVMLAIVGVAIIAAIGTAAALHHVATIETPIRDLDPGWYRWADQSNSPARFAPPEMSRFDMSARCLCQEGFKVTDVDGITFRVVYAPDGYKDTIGKVFVSEKRLCLNCAD